MVSLGRFVSHLLSFGDLADSYVSIASVRDRIKILSYFQDLVVREWTEFMMALLYGAYPNSARTLRWILETVISVGGAVLDGSLLNSRVASRPSTFAEYEQWLADYDARRVSLDRNLVLSRMLYSRPQVTAMQQTYSDLCKYSHPSSHSFIEIRSSSRFDALFVFDRKEFNKVEDLAYQVIYATYSILLKLYLKTVETLSAGEVQEFIQWCDAQRYYGFHVNAPINLRRTFFLTLEFNRLPMTKQLLLVSHALSANPLPLRFRFPRSVVSP